MGLTLMIAGFGVVLVVIAVITLIGAIGRGVARRNRTPDPTIVDSRDKFDPN